MSFSARQLAEHKAGAEALMRVQQEKVLDAGMKEISRRFPSALPSPHMYLSENEEWRVEVRVQTARGTFMNFTDPFLGFPSDLLITEIALVVE